MHRNLSECPPNETEGLLLVAFKRYPTFMEDEERDGTVKLRQTLGKFWNCPYKTPRGELERFVQYVNLFKGPPLEHTITTYAQAARFTIRLFEETLREGH